MAQFKLDVSERHEQVYGLALIHYLRLRHTRVVFIDELYTTGLQVSHIPGSKATLILAH